MLAALSVLAVAASVATLLGLRQMRTAAGWWAQVAGLRTESDLAGVFVFIPASRLLAITGAFTVLVTLLAWWGGAPVFLMAVLVPAAMALPRLVLARLRARWHRELVRQLPDALALWAGLLRAGQSSQQALGQVAQRSPGALGSELRLIQGQLRVGVAIEQAFGALCERTALGDLRLLSTLLATQRELGGNLAESLHRLAELLRTRLLMEERIGALTAQGRLQGLIVGALPVLLLAVLYVMEREAMQVLHTTWQGWTALGVMVLLEAVGFVMIRRIVRIEV